MRSCAPPFRVLQGLLVLIWPQTTCTEIMLDLTLDFTPTFVASTASQLGAQLCISPQPLPPVLKGLLVLASNNMH